MNKLLLGFLILSVCGAGCDTGSLGEPPSAPPSVDPAAVAEPAMLPVFSPALLELGTCVEGDVLTGTVTITNPGSDAMNISKIDASCGCGSAGHVAGRLNANQSRRVPISVRTKGKSGEFRGTFFVNYEQNGVQKKCSFDVKALIRTPGRILASPATVNLSAKKPGDSIQAVVELSPEDLTDSTKLPSIVRIEAPEWLQTKLNELPDSAHRWKLELSGTIPNTAGSVSSAVQVFTDCERFPICRIPVTAEVAGVFRFDSKSIVKVVQRASLPTEFSARLNIAEGLNAADVFRRVELKGFDGASLDVSHSPFENGACTVSVTLKDWNQTTNRVIKGEIVAKAVVDGQAHSADLPVILVLGNSESSGAAGSPE